MSTTFEGFRHFRSEWKCGRTSVLELVQHYLERIERDKKLNAFLEVFEEEALEQARTQDEVGYENSGRLTGLVLGIKDVIAYKNHKLSAASKILEDFESLFTATALQRLIDQGAIVIGRLNCDEFAMGSTGEFSHFGPVRNAANTNKVAGGSSSGSAVAVQAGLCTAALGSDTGGSVRQPAAFCGVVGLKPSYGTISRHGLIAYASSFDQIGIFTRNVEDAALLLEIMAGPDDWDSTVARSPASFEWKPADKEPSYSIAFFKEFFGKGLDPEIETKVKQSITSLQQKGHTIVEMELPELEYLVPTYYVMTSAEASSNLGRYDGMHYGFRAEGKNLQETIINTRTQGFGPEVKRRIMLGTFVLSSGYYDAYYTQAQKIRKIVTEKCKEVFEEVDFIISPTVPQTAFDLGDLTQKDPVSMYLEDIYTVLANLTGCPAISLPLFKHSNGLPFGLQLMTKRFNEKELLDFSRKVMER